MSRRCCNEGCTQRIVGTIPTDWYRVGYGFMCVACPEHRDIWEKYDNARSLDERSYGVAYSRAIEDFERQWDEEYRKTHPAPVCPPVQPSIFGAQGVTG